MKRAIPICVTFLALLLPALSSAQSIELMPSGARLFTDTQFFEGAPVGPAFLSAFSRTVTTVSYERTADVSSVLYLSATSPVGLGLSVSGAANAQGAGASAGCGRAGP